MKIGIVDYGMGNLSSVKNAFNYLGYSIEIIDQTIKLSNYDKLILPGVGAFAKAMENLHEGNWIEPLKQAVLERNTPILGLCLGMQLLFDESHENGISTGLGLINGQVLSIKNETKDLIVPHMGWNELSIKRDHPFLTEIPQTENDVYFVHSYYCKATNSNDVLASCTYGVEMDVIVQNEQIFGCQFHPEKSQKIGLKLLQNFCEI